MLAFTRTVLLACLIAVLTAAVVLKLSGSRLLSVQTASMVPTFRPGDALIVTPIKAADVSPGIIISYHSPRNPNLIITHRLIATNSKTGWLTTAGDAHLAADPSFPSSLLIGRANFLLPGLGRLMDILHRPLGLALAVYAPALAIIVTEIISLGRSYARPIYSVRL